VPDTNSTTTTSSQLRALADLIDAHPNLPEAYISSYSTDRVDVHWYLHIHELVQDLPAQKAAAALIIRIIGGHWDKTERSDDAFEFTQNRDGLLLEVVVNRAAVCERVVVGTHEVTVPATPAMPARPAEAERTTTVEDITWVCSSLLADAPDQVPA
jgi:hypothetical protein